MALDDTADRVSPAAMNSPHNKAKTVRNGMCLITMERLQKASWNTRHGMVCDGVTPLAEGFAQKGFKVLFGTKLPFNG